MEDTNRYLFSAEARNLVYLRGKPDQGLRGSSWMCALKDLTGYSPASPALPTFSQSAWDPSIMDSLLKKNKKQKNPELKAPCENVDSPSKCQSPPSSMP